MPEFADMIQQAYGSPYGKSNKVDWSQIPEMQTPKEALTTAIDPGSYSSAFSQFVLENILRQTYKSVGIPQQDEYSRHRRHSITPTNLLNPLLLLCN